MEKWFPKKKTMKCLICKGGETKPGVTTVTIERNGAVLVFKKTPAQVCNNCGEIYVEETVTRELLQEADTAVHAGVQVDVREFSSVAA